MIIKCNKAKLSESVMKVLGAVSNKSSLQALEGILLKAENDSLYMAGYDLELGITTSFAVTVEKPGEIILPARLFSEIVSKLTGEEVQLTVNEKLLCELKSGKTEYTILGMKASEFPDLPTINIENAITFSQSTLKKMISQTIYAVALTDQKPVHTGAKFDFKDGFIHVVAVDGFRLALCSQKASFNENISFVVPRKTLSEILKMLSENEEDTLSICLAKKHIIFEINGFSVISRLLEGDFLDYNSAIPKTHQTEVVVNRRMFIECLERASVLISDKLKSPVQCSFDDNIIDIECTTAVGKIKDNFIAKITGSPVQIGFNNKYLIDALKNCDCDEVRLFINGPLSPMKVMPPKGEEFLFLVLPVRLRNEN